MSEKDENHSYEEAAAQMSGIAEMVAALECDYDRLEELRDEKVSLESVVHSETDPEALATAQKELDEWVEENGEELKELEDAAGDCKSQEDARERIQDDPLEITLSGSWAPGETPEANGFMILLCTGGPAVRIKGELGDHAEPSRAWIEHQDWFKPWGEYHGEKFDHDVLLTYCREFYFGGG